MKTAYSKVSLISFPEKTFVSSEAIRWLHKNLSDLNGQPVADAFPRGISIMEVCANYLNVDFYLNMNR